MAISLAPQTIDLVFNGKRHYFQAHRFATPQEMYTAMIKDGVRVENEKLTAHTVVYDQGEECGRMYLLDTTVAAYAREATHMAMGILARDGVQQLIPSTGPTLEDQQDLASVVGAIAYELYTQTRYF